MKSRLLVLTAALIAVSALAVEPVATPAAAAAGAKTKSRELTRGEFEALLATPERLLIVDVRRPDEVTQVGGFPVYLSVQIQDLEKRLAWIPKDRLIVTVSNHAARSGRAADLLAAHGFNVAGLLGAQTYEEQGGRLSKVEIPPPRTAPAGTAASAAKN